MTAEEEFLTSQENSRRFYELTESDEKKLLSQLPDKKYFEFLYHVWHNGMQDDLETYWQEWSPWKIWSYPIHDLIRYKTMLLNHLDLIKEKRVATIGSHIGVEVLFSLHMGARHCVGVEPFEGKNRLASFVCQKAGYENFDLLTSELKDEHIYQKLRNFDTVVLGGLMDMIPDHYRLIDNISTTGIENIIIEVGEKGHSLSTIPNICWENYGADEHGYGPYNPSVETGLHGYPNLAFLKMLLSEFGYDFQKQDFFHKIKPETGETNLRSVSVFKSRKK